VGVVSDESIFRKTLEELFTWVSPAFASLGEQAAKGDRSSLPVWSGMLS